MLVPAIVLRSVLKELGILNQPFNVGMNIDVRRNKIGYIPEANTQGVDCNDGSQTVPPAILLTLFSEGGRLDLAVYIDNENNYLVNVSAQEWLTVSYTSEWQVIQRAMYELFGRNHPDVKRVSILSRRNGVINSLRKFNEKPFGLDISAIVESMVDNLPRFYAGSKTFSIHINSKKPAEDTVFFWN